MHVAAIILGPLRTVLIQSVSCLANSYTCVGVT